MGHRLFNAFLALVTGAIIGWSVVQFEQLNRPEAAGIFSIPGLLNFWSLVAAAPAVWIVKVLHRLVFITAKGATNIGFDFDAATTATLAALAKHADLEMAKGNTDKVRTLADAADTVQGRKK